jgi:uncharacterized membrane protein
VRPATMLMSSTGGEQAGGSRRERWARAAGCADTRAYWRGAIAVVAAIVVFAALYSVLSWLHYRGFYGGRYDLGNMVQAVYNTAHGRVLEITAASGQQMSRLGAHVDPIIALFALPWFVWPDPLMLLVAQAVIVALAGWPAYRLAVRVLGDPRAAALLAGALLVYPALGFLVLAEFHPVSLAVPLLLFAFLYLEEDRSLRAIPFLVLAALCKEEIPLLIVMMGIFFALRKRSWRPLLVSAAAGAYFLFAIGVVLPHYNEGGSPFIQRYSDFGSGPGQIARNLVLHPGHALSTLVGTADLREWWRLLWPFLLTSLVSPLTLLISLPEIVLNGLSTQVYQRAIEFQYTAGEIPFFFAAAALGVARLGRWLGRARWGRVRLRGRPIVRLEVLAALVLLAAVAGNYVLGPVPFALPHARFGSTAYARTAHDAVLDEAVKTIPANASVSVGNILGSHLSARRYVYTFPFVGDAQYIAVDQSRPFAYDRYDRAAFDQALGKIVLDPRYVSVFAKDSVFVFKRVTP